MTDAEIADRGFNSLESLCPLHEDRNPSLAVYPKTGTFRCYGCSKYGDAITFIREKENLGFRETLERLEEFGAPQIHVPATQ